MYSKFTVMNVIAYGKLLSKFVTYKLSQKMNNNYSVTTFTVNFKDNQKETHKKL